MAIQYPATIINASTITATTRTALVDFIKVNAVLAGWSIASGSSGDWILNSAISNSNQMALRIYDPGSGSTARLSPRKVDGTQIAPTDIFLLPGVSWRIIAYPSQLAVFVPGTPVSRQVGFVSALYNLPDVLGAPTPVIIAHGNAQGDTDATLRHSYRTAFGFTATSQTGIHYSNYNGTFYGGSPSAVTGCHTIETGTNQRKFRDGSFLVTEPLAGWGATGFADTPTIGGQIWGGFVTSENITLDTTITFDGRTFWGFGNTAVSAIPTQQLGSLMLAVT